MPKKEVAFLEFRLFESFLIALIDWKNRPLKKPLIFCTRKPGSCARIFGQTISTLWPMVRAVENLITFEIITLSQFSLPQRWRPCYSVRNHVFPVDFHRAENHPHHWLRTPGNIFIFA